MIFYWEGERSHVEGYQLTSSVLLTIEYWMKMERGTSTREMWWIGGGEICTGGGTLELLKYVGDYPKTLTLGTTYRSLER